MHRTFFGLIPERGHFFEPFSQQNFIKTSASTAVSSLDSDSVENFHYTDMVVPIEDKDDERPE